MSDIAELMARDPRQYSEKDLDDVIEVFRSRRHQFNAGNMRAGSTKAPTAKQKESLSVADKLDLGEL